MNEPTIFCNGGYPNCYDPFKSAPQEEYNKFLIDEDKPNPYNKSWYLSYPSAPKDQWSTWYLPFIPCDVNLDN